MNQSASQTPTLAAEANPLKLFLGSLDKPGYWLDDGFRCVRLFAGFLVLYTLGASIGDVLATQPGNAVMFWPAAGLYCAVLACTPARTWPLWIAGALLGRVLAEILVLDNRDSTMSLLYTTASSVEAVMFALFLRKPLSHAHQLERPLYLLSAFAIVGLAATALGGLLGAAFEDLAFGKDGEFWQNWRVWVAADYLGILVVSPAVMWLLLPQLRFFRRQAPLAEYLALAAVTAAIAALALTLLTREAAPASNAVTALIALLSGLPLLWSALRFDFPVASLVQLAVVVVTFLVTLSTVATTGQSHPDFLLNLAATQIYLIAMIFLVLLFSFMLVERLRAVNELHLHRGLGAVLVALTERLVGAEPEDIDASIVNVLHEIARFAGADRCVLMQIQKGSLQVEATHAWTREGVGEHPDEIRHADLSKLPWVMRQFRERGYIALDNFSQDLPAGAEELRAIQKASPTTYAAIYVGLFTDGELIGTIGCGYARPGMRWTNESVSLMYLVGQLFANVLKRKNTEKALEQYRNKLRSLAAEVTMSEERVRRRTAIDLHDGIGQNLAVARMKVGQLLARAEGDREQLNALRTLVDDALRGARHIIADLSPAILYELGLVPALQSLAERFETSNDLKCRVEEHGEAWSPANDLRITLYRSIQELLNNVARHAQAESAAISVSWSSDHVDIEVSDDGIGMDATEATQFAPSASGFGLFSVRESIELLGGTLEIESGRGLGTMARLHVPRRDGGVPG